MQIMEKQTLKNQFAYVHVYPRNIHVTWQWTDSGKRLRMCEIVCWWRKHMAQTESWKIENIDGFYTRTTQKCSFFNFYTKLVESSFLCRPRIESVNVFDLPRFGLCHVLSSSTNNFAHAMRDNKMCWKAVRIEYFFLY
jgi:hypothetical protein